MHDGFFHTFWKDGGAACMTLGPGGGYRIEYDLGRGNLVAGTGWRTGSAARRVGYRAEAFEPGSNSYLALYGWSTAPLVEYYVVESWGSAFTPPGEGAPVLGTVESDGGTYRIYRTTRVEKPSIRGTQTFEQFWSVRTARRPTGGDAAITFANHVAAWRRHGMELGAMDYQVMATEGYGSTGRASLAVWEE
jgi:endo-1,4-beta-xylanase